MHWQVSVSPVDFGEIRTMFRACRGRVRAVSGTDTTTMWPRQSLTRMVLHRLRTNEADELSCVDFGEIHLPVTCKSGFVCLLTVLPACLSLQTS
jgi:hypothetical protein